MKLAYVPEDRKGLGLLLSEDVKTNLALSNIDLISHAGLLHRSAMNKLARNLVRRLDIRPPGIDRKVTELSGGNQQKVCVARWLARDLAVLILDEPTRGVDVGAKSEIHRIIRRLAEGGLAILLISSEMPEVLGLAHRVLVMREGSITAEFQRGQATEAAILTAATGTASGGVHQATR
jgi:ABC-type sugar transport system ATPase subunit